MDLTIDLGNKKLKIDSKVISLLNSYRQIKITDCEAGGILIARECAETQNIIIKFATEPYANDKRSRFRFVRKDSKHIKIGSDLWKQYKGVYTYVGEWHTHPEKKPNYSSIDKKNWIKLSKYDLDKTEYYHIIVGTDTLGIWSYNTIYKEIIKVY